MRVWLACFVVLFALAQLFDWIQELQLPLPIYILGGAFLAVASNYDKLFGTYFSDVTSVTEATIETPEQAQLDSPSPPTGAMISPATENLQSS
ncbi:MAG: hypothetical protein HXY43_15490 [Fischerella sp.]|jgi:hypothetical protein|uniref:hypothetical protein n=1 Tax=unclassified Fischerella TaxID=494603 RepID=UPI00047BECBD|nr:MULTISPECIES: hypothetical protein [unclassified Fischerella]NWF60615.1 hypothetical protein [Fischerella sp.]